MQATSIDRRKHAGFAVNRSYQPSRIERELLAQVFDLAAHGATSQSDGDGDGQQDRDRASRQRSEHEHPTPDAIGFSDVQANQLEPAA